jgi:hypothetical protein
MKNSNNTMGNRSRDLPVCSAVPQPLRHRVPPKYSYIPYVLNSTEISIYCSSAVVKAANNEAVSRNTIYSCSTQVTINHVTSVA